jgi:geranylgeranyl pyrophosphate synthase
MELGQKKDVSNVLKKYNELFVESGILERIIPRKVSTPEELKEWNKYVLRSDKEYEETDIDAINDGLLELIYDLLDRGGKRWRPVLGMIYAECLGRNVADAIMMGSHQHDDILFACGLTEFVHNGSLMIDDVEDKSLMRRGEPCTYLKYGDDYAVNTGTIMYCVPIMKIDEFIKDDDALKFYMYKTCCEETANLHFGQNWDIHWHNGHKMPSEEQYLHMIINKTSVLPRLCVRLIARIMEEDPAEMVYYVEQLGAAFQIQDDLIAIKSDIYAKERGILAEDIHEGKRTLIVSHAYCKSNMITAAEKERLLEILDMGTKDEKILREAVDILNRSGAVEYAEMRAKSMLEEAWARVDKSLPNNSGKQKLKQLSNFLINRDL